MTPFHSATITIGARLASGAIDSDEAAAECAEAANEHGLDAAALLAAAEEHAENVRPDFEFERRSVEFD